jgi:hypothetical protein
MLRKGRQEENKKINVNKRKSSEDVVISALKECVLILRFFKDTILAAEVMEVVSGKIFMYHCLSLVTSMIIRMS